MVIGDRFARVYGLLCRPRPAAQLYQTARASASAHIYTVPGHVSCMIYVDMQRAAAGLVEQINLCTYDKEEGTRNGVLSSRRFLGQKTRCHL